MISHKHKCIFVHIPKCMGTSIEYFPPFIESRQREVWKCFIAEGDSVPHPFMCNGFKHVSKKIFTNLDELIPEGTNLNKWRSLANHPSSLIVDSEGSTNNMTMRDYGFMHWKGLINRFRNSQEPELIDAYRNFLVFTIKRDPLKRFISAYKHSETGMTTGGEYHRRDNLNINQYAERILELRNAFRNKDFTHELGKAFDPTFLKFIGLSVFDLIHLSKSCWDYINESPRINKILRLENIKEDWRSLLKDLRIPYAPLPHHRRGEEGGVTVSEDARKLIQKAYIEDYNDG